MQSKGFFRADTERLPDAGTGVNIAFHSCKAASRYVSSHNSFMGRMIHHGPTVELRNVGMAMRVINGSGSVFTIGRKDPSMALSTR